MQQLFNGSVYSTHTGLCAGDWRAVAAFAEHMGFDGVELLLRSPAELESSRLTQYRTLNSAPLKGALHATL